MKKVSANKYETPVAIPLGELAKGSGICQFGSIPKNNPNECTAGPTPRAVSTDCIGGQKAATSCTNGRAVGK
jgi:hypothetical protein